MASHQISIKNEVYERLKDSKLEDESFSDTINRLLDGKSNVKDVLDLVGSAKGNDPEEDQLVYKLMLEGIKESKKSLNIDL